MNIPNVQSRNKTIESQTSFYGYNHNLITNPYEFYDMKNIGSDNVPLLSPRKKRGIIRSLDNPQGLLSKEQLAWVDDDRLFYANAPVGDLNPECSGKRRSLISMGANIVIFPDKMIYNTSNGELNYLEQTFSLPAGNTLTATLSKLDGIDIQISEDITEEVADGAYMIDESSGESVLKVYSAAQGTWSTVETTYVKLSATGIAKGFRLYDAVNIESDSLPPELTGIFPIWGIDEENEEWIIITAIISKTLTVSSDNESAITITRAVPELDYVVESENRLWGCRWGSQRGTTDTVNEIYACSQGNPYNWYQFLGTTQDSYTLGVGSDGEFTGAAVHGGYVMFFKENCIHKIYGSKPSNYQITNVTGRGVARKSAASAAMVNETLYYLSKAGVCQYAGGTPGSIYAPFGGVRYSQAVAGGCLDKYYISMMDKDGVYNLFIYDEALSMWFKQDNLQVKFFAECNGDLYYIDGENNLCVMDAESYTGTLPIESVEDYFDWFAETAEIGMQDMSGRWYSEIQLKLSMETGATVCVELEYDSDGIWHEIARYEAQSKCSKTIHKVTPKVDHFKMRISGSGLAVIYAINRRCETGSEVKK